ncbi:MAG TPA: ABC transporter permease, partial [Acidobacteriota bacterium]
EEVAIQYATPNLFDVLGIHPIRGRTFKKDDGVGDSIIVILSHGLWLRRYGADNAIVGREIFLNGRKATVVGIMPRGFDFFIKQWAMVKKPAQLWVAFPITPENRTRQGRYLSSIARLKPGVSYDEAQANMLVLAQQLEKQYREFNGGWSVSVVPLREQISGQLRKPLWILAGAVAFVLLIACTNVANLMLSRAISRIREMAIRVALGAGRWAIIRQVLTESMLLSLMGGILGVLLAVWGTQALSLLGQRADMQLESIGLNVSMLAFAFVVSILTGLLFGIVPALTAARWNLQEDLQSGSRGTSGVHSGKTRAALVVVQLAFALILLSGAGLLIQSFLRLTSIHPGFDAKQVLSFRILLPRVKYPEDSHRISFFQNALTRFRSLPGVQSAGMISYLPFTGPAAGTDFYIEGRPIPPPEQDQITSVFVTDDGFFKTLHIPLLRGRMFTQAEMTQPKRVVLINEALAHKYFSSEDPLGKKLTINMRDDNVPTEIIGVVGDVKQENLTAEAEPSVYWPHPELSYSFMSIVLRTDQDVASLMPQVMATMQQLDPNQPVADVRVLEDWLGDSAARPKFNMVLLALLAAVALILAIAG